MLRANDIAIKGIDLRHRFITLVPNSADKSGNLKESRMQRKMRNRFCLGFAITVFLLIGCSNSETERRTSMVGTWKLDSGSTFTLRSDGSCSINLKTGSWGILTPTDVALTGTWRLLRDEFVIKISQSTYATEKLTGYEESEKIIDIDRNSFRTIDAKGKPYLYSRVY